MAFSKLTARVLSSSSSGWPAGAGWLTVNENQNVHRKGPDPRSVTLACHRPATASSCTGTGKVASCPRGQGSGCPSGPPGTATPCTRPSRLAARMPTDGRRWGIHLQSRGPKPGRAGLPALQHLPPGTILTPAARRPRFRPYPPSLHPLVATVGKSSSAETGEPGPRDMALSEPGTHLRMETARSRPSQERLRCANAGV